MWKPVTGELAACIDIRAIYATNRQVVNTSHHQLQGLLWMKGKFAKIKQYQINPVADRIGGGDPFVAGMVHEILGDGCG